MLQKRAMGIKYQSPFFAIGRNSTLNFGWSFQINAPYHFYRKQSTSNSLHYLQSGPKWELPPVNHIVYIYCCNIVTSFRFCLAAMGPLLQCDLFPVDELPALKVQFFEAVLYTVPMLSVHITHYPCNKSDTINSGQVTFNVPSLRIREKQHLHQIHE